MVSRNLNRRKGRKHLRWLLLPIFMLIATIIFLEIRLKPISANIAKSEAEAVGTEIINQSVADVIEEMNLNTDDLEHITHDNHGGIASINVNTVIANKLKTAVTLRIQKNIGNITGYRVDIPIGTLIGGDLIAGQGPSIPIYVSLSGNIDSNFVSDLKSGGSYQTVHTLSIRVHAKIYVIMPFSSTTADITTDVPLTETICAVRGFNW